MNKERLEKEVMGATLKYLKEKEWSMGNGQCPECCGAPEKWHGHPCHLTANTIGHKKGCVMAEMLSELGEKPLMMGDYNAPDDHAGNWHGNLYSNLLEKVKA